MDNIPMKNSALKMLADKRIAQENGVKTIDPPIKRSQTTDPETGAITYKQSWESSSSAKRTTPSVKKTTSISPVGSKVQPSKSTSSKVSTAGSREVTSVPIPKAAGRTDNEIKVQPIKVQTPVKKIDKETILYEKQKKEGETREQYETRNKIEQQRVNENSAKAKDKSGSGGSILTNKNKGATCKTC
jgi:hypothetical protein